MEKKNFVLRMDEQMYEALARWAADDFRSVNGQMEWILNSALKNANRLPKPKSQADVPASKKKK